MAERVWTVRDALDWTVAHFEQKGVENPRRSAEWLLSAATGLSRLELYARFDRALSDEERAAYRASIERRAAGEPLQYVTGEMPFRHLVLLVRPGVFIPRPETEVAVDQALSAIEGIAEPVVADLCTGSGAVAVSIASEHRGARVLATDISPEAAEVARINAEHCGVADAVTVLVGDLFEPLPPELRGRIDLVVANPPYIPSADMASLPREVAGFEPRAALDGGADGLAIARRVIEGAAAWLGPEGALVVETDTSAVQDAVKTMEAWYEGTTTIRDLTGRERLAVGRRRKDR